MDISGFGLVVNIVASKTFPQGFTVTQFADDADPFDLPSIKLAEPTMGLNGDLLTASKASPLLNTLNVIPSGDDDKNLAILAEANRVGYGKAGARDEITLTAVYPDGSTITFSKGAITDGSPGQSVSSAGRLKSKAYAFAFTNRVVTGLPNNV